MWGPPTSPIVHRLAYLRAIFNGSFFLYSPSPHFFLWTLHLVSTTHFCASLLTLLFFALPVRMLREELQLLQEPGSYVGEVVKAMGKTKVLVKVHPEGKYVVDLDPKIDMAKCTPTTRVALRNDSYALHMLLPNKVDPLVSLMMVEKVPDSTYEMVGGLSKQIMEIKEVIELPVKHPELFDALGISQPKGVLLYGPPGTGKTLLARAVAHHTDCTFIRVSGSELVQKYIGEGSRMVRELFVMAREHAPSIIFMDEIDSIGSVSDLLARAHAHPQYPNTHTLTHSHTQYCWTSFYISSRIHSSSTWTPTNAHLHCNRALNRAPYRPVWTAAATPRYNVPC